MSEQLLLTEEDLITSPGDYTPVDPYANLPDWSHLFDREAWRSIGRNIKGDEANLKDDFQWQIGDWLVQAEVLGRLQEKELKKDAVKITGKAWPTLKHYKVACRAFSACRRRHGLSYSFYPLLTKFDPVKQEALLDWAEGWQSRNKRPLPVKKFEREIKRRQHTGTLPPDPDNKNGRCLLRHFQHSRIGLRASQDHQFWLRPGVNRVVSVPNLSERRIITGLSFEEWTDVGTHG